MIKEQSQNTVSSLSINKGLTGQPYLIFGIIVINKRSLEYNWNPIYYTIIKAYPYHLMRVEAKAPQYRLVVDDCSEINSMLNSFLLPVTFCLSIQRSPSK